MIIITPYYHLLLKVYVISSVHVLHSTIATVCCSRSLNENGFHYGYILHLVPSLFLHSHYMTSQAVDPVRIAPLFTILPG